MTYDFNTYVERRGSGCIKYDELEKRYGHADLLPAWVADMDFPVLPEITEALMKRVSHPVYGYASVPEEFWQSIISWLYRRHGWKVGRDEITYVPGVVKAIGFVINHFTTPGDKILIQPPVYHPFTFVPEGNGRELVHNPLRRMPDGNYEMNLEDLEKKIVEHRPKMMILCNPHNPIGIQWDAETLRSVASICHRNGVKVIADEIHEDLMLWGIKHIPFASVSPEAEEISITLGAPSKTFNIAGLVSSWVVIKNKEMRESFFAWMKGNEFDDPTFFATTATIAAYNNGDEWLNQLIGYLEENQLFMEEYLKREIPEIKAVRPQASFLTWLDCRDIYAGETDTHDKLDRFFIEKAGLALNNGFIFGKEGDGFMRFNIGCPRQTLQKALDQIKAALKS